MKDILTVKERELVTSLQTHGVGSGSGFIDILVKIIEKLEFHRESIL